MSSICKYSIQLAQYGRTYLLEFRFKGLVRASWIAAFLGPVPMRVADLRPTLGADRKLVLDEVKQRCDLIRVVVRRALGTATLGS